MPPPPTLIGAPSGEAAAPETEPPSRLRIEIVREGGDWLAFEPAEAAIEAAGQALALWEDFPFAAAEAAVALTSDDRVRQLNAAYRGADKPTNVLSFPAAGAAKPAPGEAAFLGDIALAAGTVAREAASLGVPPAHHLAHLVVHGLLHLLGHDHETDAEADRMEAVEIACLARLGVPDPYAEPPPSLLDISNDATGASSRDG